MSTLGKVAAWAVLGSIVILIAAIAGYGARKSYYDSQVRELCAKDGGIKVYETVKLAKDKFDKFGNPSIPSKEMMKKEDDYFYVRDKVNLKEDNPEMWRTQHRILRRADAKVMGESISYTRRGGDAPIPLPMHGSSFTCPEPSVQPGLELSIFQQQ